MYINNRVEKNQWEKVSKIFIKKAQGFASPGFVVGHFG